MKEPGGTYEILVVCLFVDALLCPEDDSMSSDHEVKKNVTAFSYAFGLQEKKVH
jgi:hypothetical protein